MEIDAPTQAAAVQRVIETVEHQGKPAKLLVVERAYPTSVDDLWDAITSAERIPRWFLPITGDLHVGGRYQLEGNAGGEVLACDPPRRFEITWEYGGEVSWVTVELRPQPAAGDDGGTILQLRHLTHPPDEFWDQWGPGAVGIGWELGLVGLDLHVTTGAAVDRAEAAAWQVSPNARDLMARSSDAWCAASIAAGTDPDAAKAAGERILAAYTGTE